MIEGMTIGALKARIAEAQEGGLTDDTLVVMFVPLTDGVVTPLAYVDPHDLYVTEPNAVAGTLVTWDNDTCDSDITEYYELWREHAQIQHGGVPCLTIYGLR